MKCLYDILELARDADEGQIKSAYRKAARRWHPDKNKGNAEAEERFKEVQNAYEVLSDKHERAWYDAHRQDILRAGERHQAGGSSNVASGQAPEDEVELFKYFSSTCYSGYKDGPTGFYGVYEELFSRLNQQEAEYASSSDEGLKAQDLPKFGTSQSAWADVAAFYSAWSSFATCKSFSWADQYNPASAPNRKVRRLMDEENKKARKAKRKEFNETVRELISFVRKRDKRVATHQAEEAKRRLEREAEDQARREEAKKARLQRAREYEEAQWAQMDAEEDGASDSGEELVEDDLYCVACDKLFRSENALANHERSKKHLEKVEILRAVLEEEAKELEGISEEQTSPPSDHDNDTQGESLKTGDGQPETLEADSAHSDSSDYDSEAASQADSETSLEQVEHAIDPAKESDEEEEEGKVEEYESESDMLAALLNIQRGNRSSKSQSSSQRKAAQNHHETGEEAALPEAKQPAVERHTDSVDGVQLDQRQEEECLPGRDTDAVKLEEDNDDTHMGSNQKKPRRRQKTSKAKLDAAKQELKDEAVKPKASRRQKGGKQACDQPFDIDSQLSCSVCHAEFPSRTKLFKHIRDSGHAVLKS